MFFILVSLSCSLFPAFHHTFAKYYLESKSLNITENQFESFLLGSIYADGIDKSVSHFIKPVINEMNFAKNKDSDLYWFFAGVLNHISIDTYAHFGSEKSYIVPAGLLHYISELTISSWAQWNFKLKYLRISEQLRGKISEIVSFRKVFSIFYSK